MSCGLEEIESLSIGSSAQEMNSRNETEEEARLTPSDAEWHQLESRNLANIIGAHFGPSGGVDLELPSREIVKEPPSFE